MFHEFPMDAAVIPWWNPFFFISDGWVKSTVARGIQVD